MTIIKVSVYSITDSVDFRIWPHTSSRQTEPLKLISNIIMIIEVMVVTMDNNKEPVLKKSSGVYYMWSMDWRDKNITNSY